MSDDEAVPDPAGERARQVAAAVDVRLERGFDAEGVDRSVLEEARDRA